MCQKFLRFLRKQISNKGEKNDKDKQHTGKNR